jgi:hypothetical protein
MTDLDLEKLGDVWRQQPDRAELEALKRSAEIVRSRARWIQVVDVVAALVLAAVVLFIVLSSPSVDTLVVGGGAIMVLLVSQVRSRRFRQQELRSLSGSAEQMLDQSIERVSATLKRARSGLIFLGPGILLGFAVGFVADRRSAVTISDRINAEPWVSAIILVVALLAISGTAVHTARTLRKSRSELARLTALRDSYRQDRESGGE